MESKRMPLLILTVILSVTIAQPHLGPDSMLCCDHISGQECFCNVYYDGDYDYDYYLYYGYCECNEISSLTVVLDSEHDATSITFFDTNNEENVHCSFNHIHPGQEITCDASMGDRIFDESVSFKIIRDEEICQGSINTACDDTIINSMSDGCEELAITGYVGADGACDDGLEPCYCRGGFQQKYYIHDGDSKLGRNDDKNIADIADVTNDKSDDKLNADVVKKLQSGDGIVISPLFAQYVNDKDKKSGIISYSDSNGYSDSDSDSGSGSGSKSGSKSYSKSYSKSQSKSGSNSGSKSQSSGGKSNSGSKSQSKSNSKSGSKSDSSDSSDSNGNGKYVGEPNYNFALQISGPEKASGDDKTPDIDVKDEFIDDDVTDIYSHDSNDGENESDSIELDEAIAAPINIEPPAPIINIIEPDSKSSIYVTMSYYIILMIVFINTVTFGYYFCIRPLNKYCKDNNLVITYNEYFKTKASSLDYNGYSKGNINTSQDVIIQSSIDADNDTDVSPLSDVTEDEQE